MKIEIQFRGCQSTKMELPLSDSPFERVESADKASTLIEETLMSDADESGWCEGNAAGELFQVRPAK